VNYPPPNYKFLGPTNIKISPIGLGIWSWGDRVFWNYGLDYDQTDLKAIFDAISNAGVNLVDTAEVYGIGESERILGGFLRNNRENMVIATKFFPFPWRITPNSIRWAIKNSLRRLQLDYVDLYQIHMPFPPFKIEFWLKKIVKILGEGFIKTIGVSNFNLSLTKRAQNFLANHGVPLVSNQLRFSLLNREIEKNGLLAYCKEHKITVLAYSPLAMGILSGKYTPNNPPKGIRQSAYRYTPNFLLKIQPIIGLMQEIGQAHNGKSPAQVAINWAMCKGTIPIPGAKTLHQVIENIGSFDWVLTPDEILQLDLISEECLGK